MSSMDASNPTGSVTLTTIDGSNLLSPGGSVAMVLKAPEKFSELVSNDQFGIRKSLLLLLAATFFHAIYGLAMGVFSGGNALWSAALKFPLVILSTEALCAPSLYVLLGLAGCAISVRQTLALLSGLACLSSFLLVGFAPVTWLFGVSTDSLQFMVLLHALACCVSMGYGLRLLAFSAPGRNRGGFWLALWLGLFLLVSSQMITYFRPLLTPPPTGSFRITQKKFFFQHFLDSMRGIESSAK